MNRRRTSRDGDPVDARLFLSPRSSFHRTDCASVLARTAVVIQIRGVGHGLARHHVHNETARTRVPIEARKGTVMAKNKTTQASAAVMDDLKRQHDFVEQQKKR